MSDIPAGVPDYVTHDVCRLCKSPHMEPLFSLGMQYVSDFVDFDHIYQGVQCPVTLVLCKNCSLVQLKDTARQDFLYTRKYWYRSGVNESMRKSLDDLGREILARVPMGPADVWLDIGSNDGTLLRSLSSSCIRVGVEPAKNLEAEGRRGLDVFVPDFWSKEAYIAATSFIKSYGKLGFPKAKVVTAIGMFYDLEEPQKFVDDVAAVLAPDGVFVAQLMCLRNMLNMNDVGNLCHEHLEFYSLLSLQKLFDAAGLEVFDLQLNEVNGQSYRLWVRHKGPPFHTLQAKTFMFEAGIYRELQDKLHEVETYQKFALKIEQNLWATRKALRHRKREGKSIWVYGASTKGNTVLQLLGLGSDVFTGAADRSPEKWGKYTIGTGIPIFSEEEARKSKPDVFFVLPYAFLPSFMEREKEFLDRGGEFIVCTPHFRVFDKNGERKPPMKDF